MSHSVAEGEANVRSAFGEKGVRQFQRMIRQQRRLQELERLHATDTAEDPLYKVEMHVTPDTLQMRDFVGIIAQLVKRVVGVGIAGESIDGCLHILALTANVWQPARTGAVAHALYHASRPSVPCRIRDDERRQDELSELQKIKPVIDVVAHSMHVQWGMPVFLWTLAFEAVHDHIVDLVLGRIRIFAYFDIAAFFRLAGSAGIECSWITGKNAEEIKRFSTRFPGGPPNAWGVRAKLQDGSTQDLLVGFFARLFGHYATPRQLVEMIQRMPDQEARMLRRQLRE